MVDAPPLSIEYCNMCDTIFQEFSHTAIISRYGPVAFMLDSVFPARRAPAAALLVEFGVGVVRMLQHRQVVHRLRRVLVHVSRAHLAARLVPSCSELGAIDPEKVGFRWSMCTGGSHSLVLRKSGTGGPESGNCLGHPAPHTPSCIPEMLE